MSFIGSTKLDSILVDNIGPLNSGNVTVEANVMIEGNLNVTGTTVLTGVVPIGGIILWSGSIVSIPANWNLCDGTNGTPDLRDTFVVGTGGTYSPGSVGGNVTVTLEEHHLPAHTHDISGTTGPDGIHTHPITGGAHQHEIFCSAAPSPSQNNKDAGALESAFPGTVEPTPNMGSVRTAPNGPETATPLTGAHSHTIGGNGAHTHTFSATSTSVGNDAAFNILPPYYGLAYIQRIA